MKNYLPTTFDERKCIGGMRELLWVHRSDPLERLTCNHQELVLCLANPELFHAVRRFYVVCREEANYFGALGSCWIPLGEPVIRICTAEESAQTISGGTELASGPANATQCAHTLRNVRLLLPHRHRWMPRLKFGSHVEAKRIAVGFVREYAVEALGRASLQCSRWGWVNADARIQLRLSLPLWQMSGDRYSHRDCHLWRLMMHLLMISNCSSLVLLCHLGSGMRVVVSCRLPLALGEQGGIIFPSINPFLPTLHSAHAHPDENENRDHHEHDQRNEETAV